MAKRKAKTNNTGAFLCTLFTLALGIVSLIFYMVLPFFKKVTKNTTTVYSGLGCIFGGDIHVKTTIGSVSTNTTLSKCGVNVVGLIALLVVIIAIVVSFTALIVKKKQDQKVVRVLAGLLFIVAGILMLSTKQPMQDIIAKAYKISSYEGALNSAPIVGAIFSLLSGSISITSILIK